MRTVVKWWAGLRRNYSYVGDRENQNRAKGLGLTTQLHLLPPLVNILPSKRQSITQRSQSEQLKTMLLSMLILTMWPGCQQFGPTTPVHSKTLKFSSPLAHHFWSNEKQACSRQKLNNAWFLMPPVEKECPQHEDTEVNVTIKIYKNWYKRKDANTSLDCHDWIILETIPTFNLSNHRISRKLLSKALDLITQGQQLDYLKAARLWEKSS